MTDYRKVSFKKKETINGDAVEFVDQGVTITYDANDLSQCKRIRQMLKDQKMQHEFLNVMFNLKKHFDCSIGIVLSNE